MYMYARLTVAATYFSQLAFDHALTGSITVSFSVCSLTMLSQVVLQFLFQLAFDHALTGCVRVSFVALLFDLHMTSCTGACVMVSHVYRCNCMHMWMPVCTF